MQDRNELMLKALADMRENTIAAIETNRVKFAYLESDEVKKKLGKQKISIETDEGKKRLAALDGLKKQIEADEIYLDKIEARINELAA